MKEFYGNPIRINHKNGEFSLISVGVDFGEKFYKLKITSGEKTLFEDDLNEDTYIAVDAESHDNIKLTYTEIETNKIISVEEHCLVTDDLQDDIVSNLHASRETQKINRETAGIVENIYEEVREEMDNPTGTDREIEEHTKMLRSVTANSTARKYVERKIEKIINKYTQKLGEDYAKNLIYEIYSNLYGMGVIQELDDSSSVGEILVNANIFPEFRCVVYYYENGIKKKFNKTFKDLYDLESVFSRSIQFSGKELNQVENAIVEATRANGDRVTISIPGASPNNYSLNIRKFTNFTPNSESMKKSGTINDEIEKFLKTLVAGKANIGIGGEMGTGKTTMINYLLTHTEAIERKVVIASVSEMDTERTLSGHDIIVYNVDDSKGFTFEKLIKTSLRTTASRVIIPESRGEEFRQVYEANLKTRGNMFTAHALDDDSFVEMCVDMYNLDGSSQDTRALRDKISKSIDIIMIMKKVGSFIRIQSISEVLTDERGNYKGLNQFFTWEIDPEFPTDILKGKYIRTSSRISKKLMQRLNANGISMSEIEKY